MKLQSLFLRTSLLVSAVILSSSFFAPCASAQSEKKDGIANTDTKSEKPTRLKPLSEEKAKLESAQEGQEFLRRRQDWFFKPRAFPLGFIPQGARERALQQKMQMYQRLGQIGSFATPPESVFAAPPAGATSPWFAIGPQPTSSFSNFPFTTGRVAALAVNPNNANNVYLGGADGGLWVSTDGGNTWTSLTDNPPNAANIPTVAVGAIAVDPTTCGAAPGICTTVYVGTGEDNFGGDNIYGEGVLNCTITAGTPPTAACTQDSTFHATSPLDNTRGGPNIGALAVNRATGQNSILLAGLRGRGSAIQSGVWCSANKGATWTPVLPTTLVSGAGDPATDVAFASDGTAWVALGFPSGDTRNGIYKSNAPVTASGSSCAPITFTQQNLPVASASIGRITLALAPSNNATLYAAIADAATGSSTLLGVLRSVTATGATPTWTQLTDPLVSPDTATTSGFCSGQCFFDMALAVSPGSPDVVFAGGSGAHPIIRTMNGTTTASWTDVTGAGSAAPHVDTHAFAFASGGAKLWVGNDGGVWNTSGPTATTITWADLNGPANTSTGALNITQFYPGVSIHPSNPGFAMGGAQDNGIQVDEAWNPANPAATLLTWQDAGIPCDGGFTVIDPNIPSTSYGECEFLPSTLLIIAVTFAGDGILNNGFLATNGIDITDRGSFIPPFVVDQSNSQTLYFGTCRVWQTKDGANSWTAISPDVTSSSHAANCSNQTGPVLNTIAVAPSSSNTIYVGSDQGEIEVTADGGTTWTSIVTATLPTRAVMQIAVDPSNAAIAYATFSGFGTCATFCAGPTGHVFKTVNGTAGAATTWVDISGTTTKLPDIPVNAIVIDPDDSTHNTLCVGTDIGAFFTSDGGVNWSPLGALNSMPNAQIQSLTLHNPSRTLRAATHGRGLWDLNLGGQAAFGITSISPFTANAGSASTTLTVNGNGFIPGTSLINFRQSPTTITALTPTSASATQLVATIPSTALASGDAAQVFVVNGTGGPTSNSVPFTVVGQPPTITSVLPTSAPVNSPNPVTITVTGTNFGSNSVVLMNPDVAGTPLATTLVSATKLTATVPTSFMANFGSTNSVGVQNPPPGGGTTVTTATVTLPTFTVVAPAPANDNFVNAINITSTSFTDTKDSSGATTETNDPTPQCAQDPRIPFVTGRSNTIWYKFAPASNGTITDVDTIGSSYDSVLSVWSGTSQAALTAVACNDDINPGIVVQSQIHNLSVTSGTTYYIMVSSFGAADLNPIAFGGKSVLNFSFTGTTGGGGSFTVSGAALTVAAGSSGMSSITVTPSGGFTGTVNVTCTPVSPATSLPPGVTCTPNPLAINVTSASPVANNLTVAVAAPSSSTTASLLPAERKLYFAGFSPAMGGKGWWGLSAITGVAAILLLLLPGRKRYRAVLALALICVLSFTLGCSSGYNGGGGGPSTTTTQLTVSSTKVPATGTLTVSATVSTTGSHTPTGTVQFMDGTTALGSPVTLSNGSTGQIMVTAQQAPAFFQLVGTHTTVSVKYSGDTYNSASQSGALSITVTGSTTLGITGTSGSTTANGTINLTIN